MKNYKGRTPYIKDKCRGEIEKITRYEKQQYNECFISEKKKHNGNKKMEKENGINQSLQTNIHKRDRRNNK